MSSPKRMDAQEAYRHDLYGYQTGFVMAIVLTIIPFALVAWSSFPRTALLWVIGVLGFIQVVMHVRYFLHVDLSAEQREELYLMLFSGALLLLMMAGMLWILLNLYTRMMS